MNSGVTEKRAAVALSSVSLARQDAWRERSARASRVWMLPLGDVPQASLSGRVLSLGSLYLGGKYPNGESTPEEKREMTSFGSEQLSVKPYSIHAEHGASQTAHMACLPAGRPSPNSWTNHWHVTGSA